MGSMEELESRVSALEGQMRHVREDAAAARVLAGGADRDVSAFGARLDAHQRLLMALRDTQVAHGKRLDGMENRMHLGFEQMHQGFAGLERNQAVILELLRRRNGHEDGPAPAE